MIQRAFAMIAMCLALLAGAGAASAAHTSVPPKPKRSPTLPADASNPPTLQQILNGLVVSGPRINATDSENIQTWQNSSSPMSATIVADFTSKQDQLKFGINDGEDPNNRVYLLNDSTAPSMRPSTIATVSFDDGGKISISGGLTHSGKGFDGPFGFVVRDVNSHNHTLVLLFTQADLNDQVRVKVFQGNDSSILKLPGRRPGVFLDSQFLIAFETGLGAGNDHGFNDFVVLVSGIVPGAVPEPATLGLLVLSSLGLVFARRRSA